MEKKKLPLGIQDFRMLREGNHVYVDKTAHIFQMIDDGYFYFLSRPRRFGKSLTVSTLKEIFSGSKELFEGLWIYDKWDWSKTFPVIHLSFAQMDYQYLGLSQSLNRQIYKCAETYNITLKSEGFKQPFTDLIESLSRQHGKVVVLIDEYDKPIIDYLENEKLPQAKENQTIMKSFYSILKDASPYLRFVFITGVSKFSKVSIFSDLNHLTDLTLHRNSATLVGYTQEELEYYFGDYLTTVSQTLEIEYSELLEKIREWYNGFSWDGIHRVYNPFGTLQFLSHQDFRNFWSETGTPTFLLEQMKKSRTFSFENAALPGHLLNKFDLDNLDTVALLFQTGYLTIKKRDFMMDEVLLDYPNREVRSSFYGFLIDGLTPSQSHPRSAVAVTDLQKAFLKNDLSKVKDIIGTLFADLPYDLYAQSDNKRKEIEVAERFFHGIIHLIFKYLGIYIQSEVYSSGGRADSVVETPTHIYVFEFKYNRSGKAAMTQLKKNDYAAPYRTSKKTIVGIGVNFSHTTRKINGWLIENL